jgi:hypothetical protein
VLGSGIWIGVQHLGYLEFGELRRVAQRTIEQRHIVINNLAIRRAVEELKIARDINQLNSILIAAFGGNDFDAFDLCLHIPLTVFSSDNGLQTMIGEDHQPFVRWAKSRLPFHEMVSSWSMQLDLVSASGRRIGTMIVHRLYSERDLQLDVNLLISVFPIALADALQRISACQAEMVPRIQSVPAVIAARAGAD